jgi:oligopeptide/dipeptide ABC transporter ATP-binding protein
MEDVLLSVRNLKVHFATYDGVVQALDNVSFQIEREQIFGLVGETGCGKTVTSLAILRLLPDNAKILNGEIILKGENLLKKSEREFRKLRGGSISMIFQDPASSLNPVFTIERQLLRVIHEHSPTSYSEARQRVVKSLEEVGLPEPRRVLKLYPHELSGGMQQRVMLAAALSSDPYLLIADEPTSAIDVTIQAQILELLRQLKKEKGLSVLLITHNMGVVAETCDKVGVMYAGNIVEIGSLRDVLKNPRHPYVRALLAAIPSPLLLGKALPEIKGVVPSLLNPPSGCRFHPRCPYATSICTESIPSPEILTGMHQVSCYHPQED